ncbi:LLM class flavin-dependent oxidoreductase [Paraoerskovia sediminicola]|nr:LLM class flavin-dependent oxidoreductase [Paraoerskovia sediminicola]
MTLDDVSGGRVTLGIGAGTSSGFDATVYGGEPWSARERTERFGEMVGMLDRLLTEPSVTAEGTHYSAHEARTIPGSTQQPRMPFLVAAGGPRGMRVAARHGQGWVTTGAGEDLTPEESASDVGRQVERVRSACADAGRDPATLHTVLLTGFTPDPLLDSVSAFEEAAGRYAAAGIDELVVHWPIPGTQFAADQDAFERIALAHTGGSR